MQYPPLQRHDALKPLSREHFNGLRHARQLTFAAELGPAERRGTVEEFGRAWREEIEAHFDDEERLLAALVSEEHRNRLMAEHVALRGLAEQCLAAAARGQDISPELVRQLGMMLYDHIRWEERELFEAVQRSASEEQLKSIAEQTSHIETIRPGSRPRGGKKDGCGCGCSCKSLEPGSGEA